MGALTDMTVLITGASRGQGEAEARLFVAEGANVVITDVLDDQGRALADELGEKAHYVHLDISSEQAWDAAIAETQEHFGPLDVLVNNAGILHVGAMTETTLEDYRKVVNVNQFGCFLGMKAAASVMRDGCAIVNTASVSGLQGQPGLFAYAATKWAVIGMTRTAAVELAPRNIRVNAICPGVIDTPMLAADDFSRAGIMEQVTPGIPVGRAGDPSEVAKVALFLASDLASYCTGSAVVVDGGQIASAS